MDQGFKRAYQKRIKKDSEINTRFWNAIEMFVTDPFNPMLKTHKLSGKLKGLWVFSCLYDCRIIFKFIKKEVLLIDIGSYDEVY